MQGEEDWGGIGVSLSLTPQCCRGVGRAALQLEETHPPPPKTTPHVLHSIAVSSLKQKGELFFFQQPGDVSPISRQAPTVHTVGHGCYMLPPQKHPKHIKLQA